MYIAIRKGKESQIFYFKSKRKGNLFFKIAKEQGYEIITGDKINN